MTDLRVERRGPRVDITFDRPQRHNALTAEMVAELDRVTTDLATSDARVLVFAGAGGRAFAAGNEISQFTGSPAESLGHEAALRKVFLTVGALPQVTVAAVDGLCVGGGLALATYCDLRIATAGSRFGYPIARTLGNALPRAAVERCVQVFGESVTRQMLLTSRLVDAERAYTSGALLEVCPDSDALTAAVDALVDGLLAAAPGTLRTTKTQLARIAAGLPDGDDDERLLAEVYGGEEFREGVRAFLAKERPRFV